MMRFLEAWLFLSAWAALVWVLVRANQKRRLPSQPSPYATLDYRGGAGRKVQS